MTTKKEATSLTPSYFETPGVLKCQYESHGCSLTHDVRRVSFKAMYTEKVKPKEARLLTSQCSPPCDCRKTPRRPPRFLPSLSCEPGWGPDEWACATRALDPAESGPGCTGPAVHLAQLSVEGKQRGTKNDASCKGKTWESNGHQRDAVSSLGVQLEQEVLFSSFLHAPLQGISLHPGWPHQPPWKHSSAVWAAARRMLCYGTTPKCHLSHAIFAVWHWSGCLLSYFNYICPVCLCIK